MKRLMGAVSLVLAAASTFACSDDSTGDGSGSGGNATGGSATGGSATGGSATGGSATGGSSGSPTGGTSSGGTMTGGASGSGTTGGSSTGGSSTGGSGGSGATKRGLCGHMSEGTVTLTEYEAVEEFYMVSEEDRIEGLLDEYICHIQFDVTRVGEAPAGCTDLEGVACEWTHRVVITNPVVVTNVDGACEANSLGWDAAWIESLDGRESSYGYIDEYEGHDSVVMKASGTPGSEAWAVYGRASWVSETGEFWFDNRLGDCFY
jgi:hypothetical protein